MFLDGLRIDHLPCDISEEPMHKILAMKRTSMKLNQQNQNLSSI
jgi:hypothetical protein